MPSGAKKRKAKSSTKKKMQQRGGEAETHINGDDYSTGSHPNGVISSDFENDEVKSIEGRESDGAEEVLEKKDVEEAAVEEECAKEVEESVVEPPLETMGNEVETIVEEVKGDPVPVTEVNGDDGVTVESSLGYDDVEDGVSNGVGVVGDEVVDVVEEKRELNELDDNIVVTESPVDEEVVKPSEYLAEEAIDVPAGASIEEVLDLEERIVGDESLKQVVAPAEEAIPITEIPPVETSEIADPVEPELKDNGVEAPSELSSEAPISFEPDLSSDGIIDLSESTNGDMLAVPSAIDATAVVDDEQSEAKVIEPVEEATGEADAVKELETQELSEAKVDGPVIVMDPEAETATDLKIQENSEEQTVDATTVISREVDDVKSLEVPDSSEREPLTSSAPLAARRTSWMNCCGLFELFQGANR